MAEVIDLLLVFWVLLTIAVCGIGSLVDRVRQERLVKQRREEKRKRAIQEDRQSFSQRYSSSQQDGPYSSQVHANTKFDNYYTTGSQQGTPVSQFSPSTGGSYYDYYNQHQGSPKLLQESKAFGYEQQDAKQFGNHNYYANIDGYASSSLDGPIHKGANFEASIPTATGFNQDCVDWVNSILFLFFSQPDKYASSIAESVYRSLNEKLSSIISSSQDYNNLIVEFKSINRQLSSRPELTNIRTEFESEKSVSVNCKIYNQQLVLDLAIERSRSGLSSYGTELSNDPFGGSGTVNYELVLENLEGRLKSVAMLNDKLIVIQFMEKPETKILLRPKGGNQQNNLINEDILVSIILQTISQVVVDLYFGDDPDFPHYKCPNTTGYRNKLNSLLKGSANELKRQIKHDFFGALSSSSDRERKILVKLIKAKNINYNQNVSCLLELDQPYQQALSSIKQGSNPFWDEHFLFNVTDKSIELSLELWDSISPPSSESQSSGVKKSGSLSRLTGGSGNGAAGAGKGKWSKSELTSNGKFLGMAWVAIKELRDNPVQKVSLMLESNKLAEGVLSATNQSLTNMPNDLNNSVGGELELELLFLEHGGTSGGLQKSQSSVSYKQQGELVSIDRKVTPAGYVITTTTITKPKDAGRASGESKSTLAVRSQSPLSSTSDQSALTSELNLDGVSSQITSGDNQQTDDKSLGGRSRSRSRSRSFLRAIRKRLSFSRTRSRSVGEASGLSTPSGQLRPGDRLGASQGHNLDGMSVESRSRASSEVSVSGGGGGDMRAKSVPASREPSEVPVIVISRGARAGSDAASAMSFVQPKSLLVIECTEPKMNAEGRVDKRGQLRHYAIPDDPASQNRWRRRGLKLHVLHGHQFVASRLAGSSTCHLCGRVFSRRPGKQGYKCRNCHLLSHKQCHAKVDHQCPYATKGSLNLEFIDADPPASLLEELRASSRGDSLPRDLANQRPRVNQLSSKSISMDVEDVR